MKVFEVRYVGYHTPCLVVAETASQAANIAVSYRSSAWGLKEYNSPPTIESWKMLGEVIGRPWEKSELNIDEAARRAATKIRDAMPWSMTDESFEELVAEISAEFAEFAPTPEAVSDAEVDELFRIAPVQATYEQISKMQAGLFRLTGEIDRLRVLLGRVFEHASMSTRWPKKMHSEISAEIRKGPQ